MAVNETPITNDQFLGAIALPQNDDKTVRAFASKIYRGTEQWPAEARRNWLDAVCVGTAIADPYRAGVIAWLCGCCYEEGHSTELSRRSVIDWLRRCVGLANNLAERVYASLPAGRFAPRAAFDERLATLSSLAPLEYRAWQALDHFYFAATTLLMQHRPSRIAVRDLREALGKLRDHPKVHYILWLLDLPAEEPFLILEPEHGRGVLVRLSDIESTTQLIAVLTDVFHETFREPAFALPDKVRQAYLGAPSPDPAAPEAAAEPPQGSNQDEFVVTKWMLYHWTGLRDDLLLPDPHGKDVRVEEWAGETRQLAEMPVSEIPVFAGYRVVLAQWSPISFHLNFARRYPQLRPQVRLEHVLDRNEVTSWLERLRQMKRQNRAYLGAETGLEGVFVDEVLAGLAGDLGGKIVSGYFARGLRRLVPVIRQAWNPLPSDWFDICLRALNKIELCAFGDHTADVADLCSELDVVFDGIVRAHQSRYAAGTTASWVEGVRALLHGLLHPEAGGSVTLSALRSIGKVWQDAVFTARAAGAQPDEKQMLRTLIADRQLLAGLFGSDAGTLSADERQERLRTLWPEGRPPWWPITPEYPLPGIDFEAAISFAGEQRSLAQPIAEALLRRGCRVFYDGFESNKLLGADLNPVLWSVFRERALMYIVIISENYVAKPWTQLEWKAIRMRQQESVGSCIVPIRTDDALLDGLSDAIAYLDARRSPVDAMLEKVTDRVIARIREVLVAPQAGVHVAA